MEDSLSGPGMCVREGCGGEEAGLRRMDKHIAALCTLFPLLLYQLHLRVSRRGSKVGNPWFSGRHEV